MKNEDVLCGANAKKGSTVQATELRKANWIGHTLHRNCHLKHIIEGMVEGISKRERKLKQLHDNF